MKELEREKREVYPWTVAAAEYVLNRLTPNYKNLSLHFTSGYVSIQKEKTSGKGGSAICAFVFKKQPYIWFDYKVEDSIKKDVDRILVNFEAESYEVNGNFTYYRYHKVDQDFIERNIEIIEKVLDITIPAI